MNIKVEKIKTKFGNIRFFKTKEASFNIETVKPGKKLPKFYLRRNKGILIILEGVASTSKGELKKGDVKIIKPREKFEIKNIGKKTLKYLAVDIPPVKEKDVVWLV